MVINDGAGELAHGTTFSESTTFNAVEGPATLWLYTNGDDPGPLPVAGEEIVFNGAVVGGPINANLGLRASLFEIPIVAIAGLNTLEIRTPVSGSADNFNWPVAVLAPPTPALVPFARFGARAQIVLGPGTDDDRFAVEALFTLGAASNGIDLLMEPVTLALGTEEWTIPPGSFHRTRLGSFVFKGPIGATHLVVTIQPFRGGTIGFAAWGAGAELTGTENPVDVRLIVGDDGGTTTVVAKFLAPGDD